MGVIEREPLLVFLVRRLKYLILLIFVILGLISTLFSIIFSEFINHIGWLTNGLLADWVSLISPHADDWRGEPGASSHWVMSQGAYVSHLLIIEFFIFSIIAYLVIFVLNYKSIIIRDNKKSDIVEDNLKADIGILFIISIIYFFPNVLPFRKGTELSINFSEAVISRAFELFCFSIFLYSFCRAWEGIFLLIQHTNKR